MFVFISHVCVSMGHNVKCIYYCGQKSKEPGYKAHLFKGSEPWLHTWEVLYKHHAQTTLKSITANFWGWDLRNPIFQSPLGDSSLQQRLRTSDLGINDKGVEIVKY